MRRTVSPDVDHATYLPLAYAHLATVVPAVAIGTWLMVSRKGSGPHRVLGRAYMVLMFVTGVISLLMPAAVGPTSFGHFGFIHLFSLLTLWSVPAAWFAARRHDVLAHRGYMIGLFVGGILIAGAFAFMPGRLLNQWLFA